MPEYLAPGVYVEEVSFRSKSIEGVSTTTTGFVGPARYGPVDLEPELLTSLLDFERVYGDRGRLEFAPDTGYLDPGSPDPEATVGERAEVHNDLWHAVRAFFDNGGRRLYVQRVFRPTPIPDEEGRKPGEQGYEYTPDGSGGRAGALLPLGVRDPASGLRISARFPGAAGDRAVRLTLRMGVSVFSTDPATGRPQVAGLGHHDVVAIGEEAGDGGTLGSGLDGSGLPGSGPEEPAPLTYAVATRRLRPDGSTTWIFTPGDPGGTFGSGTAGSGTAPDGPEPIELADLPPGSTVRRVTLALTDIPPDPEAPQVVWADLPLDPRHRRGTAPDSLFDVFAENPANRADALALPVVVEPVGDLATGTDLLALLFEVDRGLREPDAPDGPSRLQTALESSEDTPDAERSILVPLTGGDDGVRPTADEYAGRTDPGTDRKTGLVAFEDIEDISIVAAPGCTRGYETSRDRAQDAFASLGHLISHCQRMRFRIAVLDAGDGQTLSQIRALRARLDSTHAALYYPWVRVLDPVTQQEIALPPSGFVCGIYARNDIQRAVYKAPANEVVSLAVGFERTVNKAQQDVLNPEGINCLRWFPGRGYRVWGARTISSDPEWKYVSLRRYFAYLEHSIDRGTQWAVFEPNGELLWDNVRRTIYDFLYTEWENGALLGDKPEKAFFVRCDRSTMTQNDLDNGRLICLIGIAPVRPAEFVVFRIGQWTADRRV
jgi:phage tail sheath protein FI